MARALSYPIARGISRALASPTPFEGGAAAFVPLVPLSGAAVDIRFDTGQSYPDPLSTLLDGTHTHAAGALLAAMSGATVTVLLSVKVLGAAPDGTAPYLWINGTGAATGIIFQAMSDTSFRCRKIATSLTATLGSGAFSTTPSKIGIAWDGTGRSLVGNNGAVATDAQIFSSLTGVTFVSVDTMFNRLTVWTSKLSNATLQGLTV